MLVLAAAGGFVATTARGELRVVTATPTLADIVRQIGQDHVTVQSVMRGPENVHNVSPKPSQMMRLKKAALFVHSGLDAEPWVPLLIKGARNPRLLPGQPGNVDVSRGIALKEVPTAGGLSRAFGDIHVYGNTHYVLDPLNGVTVAGTIAEALKHSDPRHAGDYEVNCNAFSERLQALADRLVREMEPYWNTPVVTYHRTWPYFLDRFRLKWIADVEPKPGIAPGPRHLSACVDRMRGAGARIVIVETFSNKKNAEHVAQTVDGIAVVLAQEVGAVPGVDTYEQLFVHNVKTLMDAFRNAGIVPPSASATPRSTEEPIPATQP